MIRFTDIIPAAEPKKAAAPTPEREPAPRPTAAPASDLPKPAKTPRKPRKSA